MSSEKTFFIKITMVVFLCEIYGSSVMIKLTKKKKKKGFFKTNFLDIHILYKGDFRNNIKKCWTLLAEND